MIFCIIEFVISLILDIVDNILNHMGIYCSLDSVDISV